MLLCETEFNIMKRGLIMVFIYKNTRFSFVISLVFSIFFSGWLLGMDSQVLSDEEDIQTCAQLYITVMLPEGKGSDEDKEKARIYFEKIGDQDGENALYNAVRIGHKEVIGFLKECGVKATECKFLHCASERGDVEIVSLLLEMGSDINTQDEEGQTALLKATDNGHLDVVKRLLDHGADINARNNYHETAFYVAAKSGYREIVDLLLEKGFDSETDENFNGSSVYEAADNGSIEGLALLIDIGADMNAPNWDGSTALHISVSMGFDEKVEVLLEKGADINAKDDNGDTPLHRLARSFYAYGNKSELLRRKLINLLLEKGADSEVEDDQGRTALHYAAENGYSEIVEALLSHPGLVWQCALGNESFERIFAGLCCIRRYALLPKNILFMILNKDPSLQQDVIKILMSGLKQSRSRSPFICIRNNTQWLLKITYQIVNEPDKIEALLCPENDLILEEHPDSLLSLDFVTCGKMWEWVPLNFYNLYHYVSAHQNSDILLDISGGQGTVSQFMQKYPITCTTEPVGEYEKKRPPCVPANYVVKNALPLFSQIGYDALANSLVPKLLSDGGSLASHQAAYSRLKALWEKELHDNPQHEDFARAVLSILEKLHSQKESLIQELNAFVPPSFVQLSYEEVTQALWERIVNKKTLSQRTLYLLFYRYFLHKLYSFLAHEDNEGHSACSLALAKNHNTVAKFLTEEFIDKSFVKMVKKGILAKELHEIFPYHPKN